jgi:hypothetical protein
VSSRFKQPYGDDSNRGSIGEVFLVPVEEPARRPALLGGDHGGGYFPLCV